MNQKLKAFAKDYDDPLALASALLSEASLVFETELFKEGSLLQWITIVPDNDETGYHIGVMVNDFTEEEEEEQ